MNKHEREIITYKKRHPKSFRRYIAMMQMAIMYNLSEDEREALFAILDEPPIRDWEWRRELNQEKRIKAVFKIAAHSENNEVFAYSYHAALEQASMSLKVIAN